MTTATSLRRTLAAALVATAATIATTGAASAAWSARGTGSGSALAGSLAAPTAVAASLAATTATVSWTAPASLPAGATYVVTRSPAGGTCVLQPVTGCVEVGLAPGTYTWTVRTAVGSSWQSAPATSTSVTVLPPPPPPPVVATTFTVAIADATVKESGNDWTPRVRVTATNNLGAVQADVLVTARLGPVTSTDIRSCTTGTDGTCTMAFTAIKNATSTATVTVTSATHATLVPTPGSTLPSTTVSKVN